MHIKTFLPSAFLAIMMFGCGGSNDSREPVTLTGSSTIAPLAADAAKRYEAEHPGVRIEVQTGGTSRGIADVQAGLADLGMASRTLKPDESALTAHRIAMDGVCLIAHIDNPVTDLTKQQVIDIFTGKIDNWDAFGFAGGEIVVANKAEGRATLEVFLAYTGLDSANIEADVVVGENQQAIKTVAGNPAAIGYVSIGTAASESAAGTPIKLLASDGVAGSVASVADGTFPITRPLQIVTGGSVSPGAARFLEYLKSAQIDDLVESHLYVPIAH